MQSPINKFHSEARGKVAPYFAPSLVAIATLIGVCTLPRPLFADGGTLRAAQRIDNVRVSVFTSPASPRVGLIDVSVLVQDAATGKVLDDVPAQVRLQSLARTDLRLEQTAASAAAT